MENRILPAEQDMNWGAIYQKEIRGSDDPLVRFADSLVYHCATLRHYIHEDEHYVKAVLHVVNRLRERAEPAESRLREWQRALHDLTPGGSEFVDGPKRCAEWVRGTRLSQHQAIVRLKTEKDAAEKKLAELSAIVEPLRVLHEECQPDGDRSPADVYYARVIMRDRLYEAFPKIAALVPPVEKGEK